MKYSLPGLLLLAQIAFANPVGEMIVSGEASLVRDGDLTVRQSSHSLIIEWEDFSIHENERTTFIQPSPDASVLNKVYGSEISKIYGTLESNGQVVLVNPNGVIVGKTGIIQAGAFLCSSSDISYSDFEEGNFDFAPTDFSSFINIEGRVEATRLEKVGGRIFLVADDVNIEGALVANSGQIDVRGNSIEHSGLVDVSGSEDTRAGTATLIGEDWVDFSGRIHAIGGPDGGDGGFVEVSTRGSFNLTGSVDTMAPKGLPGMFLIDPTNVTLRSAVDMNTTGPAYNFTGSPVFIQTDALVGFLNSTPVTISTANTVDQGEAGNLTIDATADFGGWNNPNALTFLVNGDFTIASGATIGSSGSGVAGGFLVQAGGNILVDADIYTSGGDISLRAGPESNIDGFSSTGSITIHNVLDTIEGGGGLDGGALILRGYDITTDSTTTHQTSTGRAEIFAQRDLIASSNPTFLTTTTGTVTIYANRNVTLSPAAGVVATGAFVGQQIDIQADFDRSGEGDFLFGSSDGLTASTIGTTGGGDTYIGGNNISVLGASPSNGGGGTVLLSSLTTPGASIELEARNNILFAGGTGSGASSATINSSGDTTIRAGNNISFQGGEGSTATASANSGALGVGTTTVVAGNDVNVIGGTNAGVIAAAAIAGDLIEVAAGNDIILTAGPGAADGVAIAPAPGTTVTPILRAGRNIIFTRTAGATAEIADVGVGCDIRAGGDIQYTGSLNATGGFPISIAAGATGVIFLPQSGPYVSDTILAGGLGSVGYGGFRVDTGAAGGGIEFVSDTGDLTLYSTGFFSDGTPSDIIFDGTGVANAQRLASTSGNIQVAGFRNIDVNNSIATGGAILIASNNTMNVNTPSGFVTAGGPITLIVDEQDPTSNGGGFFNNFNSGVSTSDPDQRIAIYAASGPMSPEGFSFPNQVVLGNLETLSIWDLNQPLGLLTKYSTSYESGGQVHGAGFGSSYLAGNGVFSSPVIWYKVGADLPLITNEALFAMQALREDMPERLWMQQFSILINQKAYLDHLALMMNHERREQTIQSRYAIAEPREYLLRATLSGQSIRILDQYQEFLQGVFWNTPYLMYELAWLESDEEPHLR